MKKYLETSLCKICQLTGVLCSSCEEKLRDNEITKLDVDISIYLGQKTRGRKEYNKYKFNKALYIEDYLVLVFEGEINKAIKNDKEKIFKEMEEKFRVKVFVVEQQENLRKFIEKLFYPIQVKALNMIWIPDGSVETKVILGGRIGKKRINLMNKITKKIKNIEIQAEYQQR